jgi:NAD(P)-dependent dehydrogenase (short-subunit alcohol dehydrogenase family)
MNKYELNNKIAIVTGARRGIGEAIALKLAENKAKVVVTDVNKEDCELVTEKIKKAGGEAIALKLDVTDEGNIKEVVGIVKEEFGRIDILINNAGIFIQEELDKMDTSKIEKIIDVNLKGVILCSKYVIPEMKLQKYGKIISIASVAGFVGFDLSSIYCATKGGIINLTRELAIDLGKYKINVNAIAPGAIKTAMIEPLLADENIKAAILAKIPYGRIGRPEDIANGAAFLASGESEYITGHTIVVDGGWLAA